MTDYSGTDYEQDDGGSDYDDDGDDCRATKPVRLRHELKHQIPPQEDLVLAGRLRRLFPHDAHAGAHAGRPASVSTDDAALREKVDAAARILPA